VGAFPSLTEEGSTWSFPAINVRPVEPWVMSEQATFSAARASESGG